MTEIKDTNIHFHQELDQLERKVLSMVDRAEQMVEMAVEAATTDDMDLAARVIELDSDIDETYLEVHQGWTALMARHQPLGSDLRRMTILIQLNVTFERMGDQCVNIAKIAQFNHGLPPVERIRDQIREMGDLVRPMIRTAIEAYVRADLDEARLLPAMDQPVDRLNANMYKETVAARANPEMLEWATKMLMAARALERVGDQAVDFAEQTAYLITGERAEFDEDGMARALDDYTDRA
jgi:phosphate transport system protein